MSGAFRMGSGGRIDRGRTVRFSFDGQPRQGFAGDTLASALLADGVHLVGRSFKYHRPRGIVAAGADEPNALVGVGADQAHYTPNLRATQVELYEGLVAVSQNRTPSLRFDIGAVNDLLSPLIPAGFYYKTFMWPAGGWKRLYEPAIRAAAGLGRAPTAADGDRYAQLYAHCEVLVVGAGPAGLAAALAASEGGARVILCDEQAELGGSLLAPGDATIDGVPGALWLANAVAELRRRAHVTLLPRTTAFGYFPHNLLGLAQRVTDHMATPDPLLPREVLWQVRTNQVVLAQGAIERPLVFSGNDRPGVMLADAARVYAERYAVRAGRRVVVATAHDDAYHAALALHRVGCEISAIADLRPEAHGAAAEAAREAGLPIHLATRITSTSGRLRVRAATLGPVGRSLRGETIACDLLLMSGGFTPGVHLFSQSRGTLRFDAGLGAYLPDRAAERTRCAGAGNGAFGLAAALREGSEAGAAAAGLALGRGGFVVVAPAPGGPAFLPQPPDVPERKAFVDFQNDVTTKDLALAAREGFRSIEHIKRYTTTGMATDQGKTSNMNALALVAGAAGRTLPEVGLTSFRMPYTPVTFGTLAGASRGLLFDPVRTTPIHDSAAAAGAVFEDVGQWRRARYFPRPGEDMHAAVDRECLAVRNAAGVFDASTLGKIEVVGPDAATFLERMYVNAWAKLAPGRCRYGIMLREDGFIADDGVVGRLAPDRFHVTTTTGGAARVLGVMEDYLQTEWPELDVWLTSTTEQWAVIAVQGPRARDIVAPLIEGVDFAAFPHMSVAECRILGLPGRLFRVSFTGELGFELNVPADYGAAVWQAVLDAGRAHGITPYGTEAMHVLRAEKGYIVVGQDTDGTATPDDVGLGWAIGRGKPDFVGKRSLARPAMALPTRRQLVGLLTADPGLVLEEGAQVVADPLAKPPMRPLGHVTSSYASATLERSIALAMIEGGRARIGETLHVPLRRGAAPPVTVTVTVVLPVFLDPQGERLHG
jgi:sarcosine oxidase subunit alpha